MIGIDIVKISRIKNMYDKFGKKALRRFLSKKEIKLTKNNINTIAGFWASKEAGSKAIGTGIGSKCGFLDMKITKTKQGQPQIKYKKHLRKKFKIKSSYLSITHDNNLAIGVVVLQKGK